MFNFGFFIRVLFLIFIDNLLREKYWEFYDILIIIFGKLWQIFVNLDVYTLSYEILGEITV